MRVRPLRSEETEAALALNNAAVPAVNHHDAASFAALVAMADRSWVVATDDRLCALLVTFAPDAGYESANYRWVQERFDDFRYVDRIVVDPDYKRQGLGSRLYGAFEDHARAVGAARLLCEVNVDPPNPQSIAFHLAAGWQPIADRRHGPGKVVRYFQRPFDLDD